MLHIMGQSLGMQLGMSRKILNCGMFLCCFRFFFDRWCQKVWLATNLEVWTCFLHDIPESGVKKFMTFHDQVAWGSKSALACMLWWMSNSTALPMQKRECNYSFDCYCCSKSANCQPSHWHDFGWHLHLHMDGVPHSCWSPNDWVVEGRDQGLNLLGHTDPVYESNLLIASLRRKQLWQDALHVAVDMGILPDWDRQDSSIWGKGLTG